MVESTVRGLLGMFGKKKTHKTHHTVGQHGHDHAGNVLHTSAGSHGLVKKGLMQKIKEKIPGYRKRY
ncbi:hypothetical protein SUGI_0339310 [Cryptomeria japonica]|nr:hypothetical protein SUGI_0339310 [Cryptomeria japonica]